MWSLPIEDDLLPSPSCMEASACSRITDQETSESFSEGLSEESVVEADHNDRFVAEEKRRQTGYMLSMPEGTVLATIPLPEHPSFQGPAPPPPSLLRSLTVLALGQVLFRKRALVFWICGGTASCC